MSNAHKWMYTSRGCAVMYTERSGLLPVITSTMTDIATPTLERNFLYHGTRDNTAILSLFGALRFREAVGDAVVRTYQRALAVYAAVYLSSLWSTSILGGLDRISSMANVVLPGVETERDAQALHEWILREHNVYLCPPHSIKGIWFTRVSCPVYLNRGHVEQLGDLVMEWAGSRRLCCADSGRMEEGEKEKARELAEEMVEASCGEEARAL